MKSKPPTPSLGERLAQYLEPKTTGMITLAQIFRIEDHDAQPCNECGQPASGIQGFAFERGGKRICGACALASGFTITPPDLLNRILAAYAHRNRGRAT